MRAAAAEAPAVIATRPRPDCPICGAVGEPLYGDLHDRWHDAPGRWNISRCPDAACGTGWLDPVPTEDDVGKAYVGEYYTHDGNRSAPRLVPVWGLLRAMRRSYLERRLGYERWTRSPRLGHRVRSAAAFALLHAIPGARDIVSDSACHLPAPGDGARLLEVGFGSADQLARMRALGWTATGVDPDPVAVERARSRGLQVQLGDLASQGFEAGSFDAIYMSHVIEHVHDPVEVLRECARVLRPGGAVVLVTPNLDSAGHRHFGVHAFALEPPRHLVLFTPQSLTTAVRAAGFDDIRSWTTGRIAFLFWLGSASIRRAGHVEEVQNAKVPLRYLAPAVVAHLAEAAIVLVRRSAGEELMLVARTPVDGPPVSR